MIRLIKWLIYFFTSPMNVFWIGIAIAIFLKYKKSSKAKFFLYGALIWLLITGTRWIPDLMVYGLERQYDVLIPDPSLDGLPILVLGGGSVMDLSVPPQERLSSSSKARLNEGIRLSQIFKNSLLICSGHSPRKHISQAAMYRDAAIALGVPEEKIKILEAPTTTEKEAMEYRLEYGAKHPRLILVTSDIHMPRAVYLFRKAGLDPIPASADHLIFRRYESRSSTNQPTSQADYEVTSEWLSDRSNFQKFQSAIHEYIGLLWAKM